MIVIVNVAPGSSPFGEHEYEVRINEQLITRFLHKREEGLAVCLRRASEAVARDQWQQAAKEFGACE